MITCQNEALGKLDCDPARGFNRLSTFIDHEHVKELIVQLSMDVLAKGLICCRSQGATNDICISKHLVDGGHLELPELLPHHFELVKYVVLFTPRLGLSQLER